MTFEEYEEKHLHDLNHEARRLVRMGWNARGTYGADTDDGTKNAAESSPIVWIDPEDIKRTMIASPGERAEVAAFKEDRFTTPLYENAAPELGEPQPIIPGDRFSVEAHGNGYAIYRGRTMDHHGENLGQLTECLPYLPKMIEAALNASAPVVFSDTAADIEARLKYDLENSCPHCGGSGHKDDCSQGEPEQEWGDEPDMFWDADTPDMAEQSPDDLADYCGQDMRVGDSMVINVMSAKTLPARQMKVWVDGGDDLQWEWIESPQPPQEQREGE